MKNAIPRTDSDSDGIGVLMLVLICILICCVSLRFIANIFDIPTTFDFRRPLVTPLSKVEQYVDEDLGIRCYTLGMYQFSCVKLDKKELLK